MKSFTVVQIETSAGVLLDKWRYVERTHKDGNVTEKNLCRHKHNSPEAARECPSVVAQIPPILTHRLNNPRRNGDR